ncbi:conserved hypothetical protein [Pseudomonas sp. 8Z]|uniref:response regulator n=1 Tax=Pseudomonas sp. 8Z TaxID=2653166 RepID=UPI0012F2445A|nr:response regulator [Pseudomonas sp. 8Z]VXC17567.1 conserved hypothetical protein [Pseudomonas sp. 8Z]
MARLLLLDDEPAVLNALCRELRSTGWLLDTFSEPQEALLALSHNTYELVLSDLRMPELDGVAFLQFARQLQPDALRLLLSGDSDRESLVRAVNKAEIYRFISKPWDAYELCGTLQTCLELQQALTERKALLERISRQQATIDAHEAYLRDMRHKHPDIFTVKRAEDGAVLLQDDE